MTHSKWLHAHNVYRNSFNLATIDITELKNSEYATDAHRAVSDSAYCMWDSMSRKLLSVAEVVNSDPYCLYLIPTGLSA